jgi:hypothetical protein
MRRHIPTKRISPKKLLEWLEGFSARRRYDYLDRKKCLMAQFFGCTPEDDREVSARGRSTWRPHWPDYIAVQRPWTFGAAAKRLRRYIETGSAWRE